MLISVFHLLFYALIQTFGISIFTISLKRIGILTRVYRIRSFLFLVAVNVSGTLTFGEAQWLSASRPIAGGLFLVGMAVFFICHGLMAWKYWRIGK